MRSANTHKWHKDHEMRVINPFAQIRRAQLVASQAHLLRAWAYWAQLDVAKPSALKRPADDGVGPLAAAR